jgi:hypothetical protein
MDMTFKPNYGFLFYSIHRCRNCLMYKQLQSSLLLGDVQRTRIMRNVLSFLICEQDLVSISLKTPPNTPEDMVTLTFGGFLMPSASASSLLVTTLAT